MSILFLYRSLCCSVTGALLALPAGLSAALPASPPKAAPYPPSPHILGVTWAPTEFIVRRADGSDTWPMTWSDDDRLYTAYGDGNGFEPFVPQKLSMGIAWVEGDPPAVRGVNVRSPTGEFLGNGKAGRKASGMLMVKGVLYMLVRNLDHAQLASSRDHGMTWSWADWRFTTSFGCPTFLNFGKDYMGARDGYVYIYSPDSDDAYTAADRMVLARVPENEILRQTAYEYFAGLSPTREPQWSAEIARRAAVFENGGHCFRGGITYNPALHRYLWCQILPESHHPEGTRFQGGFGIYDAPEPWGPWTTVFYTPDWDVGPGDSSSFPTKWMSADGRRAWLVFSNRDSFALRKAEFSLPH
jgi:hypothetical protein